MARAGEYFVTSPQGLDIALSTDGTTLSVTKDGSAPSSIGGGGGAAVPTHQTGLFIPQDLAGSNGTSNVASGTAYGFRFTPLVNMTVTKIAFNLATPDSVNSPVEIALYTAAGIRVATSGQVAVGATSAGVKLVPISASLTAGQSYYAVFCVPTVTTTFGVTYMGTISPGNSQLFGTTLPLIDIFTYVNGSGVLAADISAQALTLTYTNFHQMAIRTD